MPAAWLWALVLLLAGILCGVGLLAWRARRSVRAAPAPGAGMAAELHRGLPQGQTPSRRSRGSRARPSGRRDDPVAEPSTPLPEAASIAEAPVRIDLSLQIVGATRSVMMFSLEYRLTLCNRTQRALRDLRLSARLACAKRGIPESAAPDAAEIVGTIDRIGPQQSRSLTARAQIALSEIEALRQGRKPLFIPMLHLILEGPGIAVRSHSFVIGSPSQAGITRLHPIPLDTPPGGIHGLRANEIRIERIAEPA